ncbi:MAG: SgcJ/EcaC family oxidoreductase [Planctomycetia bacterium]|nr:SgcJ/EcaC family oxidoreductase [Planctomycetia bacterium]
MNRLLLTAALLFLGLASAVGGEPARQAADEAAIRKSVESYVASFNQGDAGALAALWAPTAVYTNPLSGEQVAGRDAIKKQFAAIFDNAKGAKLEAKTESIQFISPSVAVERGTAKVIRADQAPEESDYTAVYVKRDDQWLLDRVTEEDVPVVQSHHEQLKELDWMVGSWIDEDKEDNAEIVTECQWTKNQNFMTRSFKVTVGDRVTMSGMQIIGWDAASKQIRSWVFDSDGGYAEGTWQHKGNRWYIKQSGVLPDGGRSSEVNILTKVDNNAFTWQSTNREIDGEVQPNIDEVKVVRDQKQ